MQSILQRYRKTQRGRVVYERKLHPWTERDLERVAGKLVNQVERDEPAILGIFYRITESLLAQILKLVRLEVFAPQILRFLVDRANELLELVGFHLSQERQQSEAQAIVVRFTPYCEREWLAVYGEWLNDTYSV